jgi:hypothetical protein
MQINLAFTQAEDSIHDATVARGSHAAAVLFHISADSLITPHARRNSAILPGASADARGRPRRPRASP